jgi:hypothetical protein
MKIVLGQLGRQFTVVFCLINVLKPSHQFLNTTRFLDQSASHQSSKPLLLSRNPAALLLADHENQFEHQQPHNQDRGFSQNIVTSISIAHRWSSRYAVLGYSNFIYQPPTAAS